MNSVIAYKQFSLGEGLAELFAPEIKNLEAFKASLVTSTKGIRSMFGYSECYTDNWKDNDSWKERSGYKKDCRN